MQIAGRHKNDTGGNERKPQTVHLNDAISRPIQTGIDAEDAYQGRWHKKDCAIGQSRSTGLPICCCSGALFSVGNAELR